MNKFYVLKRMVICFLIPCVMYTMPLYSLSPEKNISQYYHRKWTTEQGLPHSNITSIVQSVNGYIWMGTHGGLVVFDGMHFETYSKRNVPEFESNQVVSLLETRDGKIWAGTYGGGIVIVDFQNKNQVMFSRADISAEIITAMDEDSSGTIWAATYGAGLFCLKNNVWTHYTTQNGMPDDVVRDVICDDEGVVWAGTNKGLVRIQKDMISCFSEQEGLPEDVVRVLYKGPGGSLWVGTDSGLSVFADGMFHNYGIHDGLNNTFIRKLFSDRDGNLWIGTRSGLQRLKNREIFDRSQNIFSDETVTALMEDREGNLWAGTRNGLHQLVDTLFTPITVTEGLPDDYVMSVYKDSKGTLWVGTNNGGLVKLSGDSVRSYNVKDGLPVNYVLSICEDQTGRLYFGTYGGGLCFLDGDKVTVLTEKEGLPNSIVKSLFKDSKGNVWVGTRNGLCIIEDSSFTVIPEDTLTNNYIRYIYEDNEGTLWVCTNDGGLNFLKSGSWGSYTEENGLSSNLTRCIYQDCDGIYWVGTYGGGLNRLENGQVTVIDSQDGLSSDVIFSVLESENNLLWLSTTKGIVCVDRTQIKRALEQEGQFLFRVFDSSDGLVSNVCSGGQQPSAFQSDNVIWFATDQGLIKLDPRKLNENPKVPPVHIERVFANGNPVNLSSPVVFEKGSKMYEIHYTGLSYADPSKVRFRYRLENADEEWVEAGIRRVAYYSYLPPGDYVFRVQACNNSGVWNRIGAEANMTVKPMLYQTTVFRLMILLLTGLILFGGYRFRVRFLKKREAELVSLVDEQTEDLRQISEFKSELLHILAHDLKNPIQMIVGSVGILKVKGVIKGDDSHKLNKISDASSRMLKLIESTLKAGDLESKKFSLEIKQVNMTALVKEAVRDFEQAAFEKCQNLKMNIQGNCKINGDEQRIREIIDNLISNALKYSLCSSTVTIILKKDESGCLFSVKDEGPGFTEEDKEKCFRKFQKLSAKPTGKESSSGLGLFIVKKLVDAHKGDVWVNSEPGKGAVFNVRFPAFPEQTG